MRNWLSKEFAHFKIFCKSETDKNNENGHVS